MAAFLLVALAIYLSAGNEHTKWNPAEVPITFWAWRTQIPSEKELRETIEQSRASMLFLRAGQLDFENGEVKRIRPAVGKLADGVPVHLVYNGTRPLLRGLETIEPARLAVEILKIYTADVERFSAEGARITGLQLDIDYPTRLLSHYATTAREIRRRLPSETKLSITGLPTWMDGGDLGPLLETVDFWIPQLYGGESPTHLSQPIPITSLGEVKRYVTKARKLGKPFFAGLAAYGYAIHYDRNGDLVEVRGDIDLASAIDDRSFELISQKRTDQRHSAGEVRHVFKAKRDEVLEGLLIAAGESIVFDSPTPDSLREAGRIVRENAGEQLLGISVFRLPTIEDTTNLRTQEIVDSLRDSPFNAAIEVSARKTGERSFTITAANTGTASSFSSEALVIEIAVPPGSVRGFLAHRGFTGFETLCFTASGSPRKCSGARADVIRLTKNAWRAGDEAWVNLSSSLAQQSELPVNILTRYENGRSERTFTKVMIEEKNNND